MSAAAAALIPVKAFSAAKHRLSGVLDDATRASFAREMASTVVRAAAPLRTFIVCDDDEVAAWAREQAAEVIWTPGLGLNGAITEGVSQLRLQGIDVVTIVHADLPNAEPFGDMEPFDGASIVPDRFRDGTNLLRIPAGSGFTFSYGPGSFDRHLAAALELGMAVHEINRPDLAFDVDRPEDLEGARTQLWGPEGPHSR